MRIVTNRKRVQRNRNIAQYLFFLSLAVLFGGLIFTNTLAKQNDSLLLLPCAVMPIGLVTTIVSVRLTNQYVRLPHPEDAIRDGLKGINRRSILYNYVLTPNHVLITPQGVFSLTTRFQETRFKVEGDQWFNAKGRGLLAPMFLFFKQEALGDPFKQAQQEADSIQPLVDQALPGAGIKVQPAVVFTSSKATLEVIDPDLPVVYADAKKKPALKAFLKADKQKEDAAKLTPEQIEAIDSAFMTTLDEKTRKRDLQEDEG